MRLDEWRRAGRSFRHRGHEIFYRREGTGEVLLLIHGFPTASWDWHRIWDGLAARFDVVAPDMIGFGFSSKPRDYDYSLMDQATLHESLLADLGVSSTHVVAHDYGDTVAQELLARHAERTAAGSAGLALRSTCLLNGGMFPGEHRPIAVQKLLMSPIGGLLVHVLSVGTLRRSLRKIFGPRTQPTEAEVREFWALIEHADGRRIFHKLIRYMREREVHRDRWVGSLKTTAVPLLHVNGLADPISGRHVADVFRREVPGAALVALEDIGHYPQVESPEAVLQAILEFVERASGRAATGAVRL